MPRKIITVYNEETDEYDKEVNLPGKWEICWRCRGEGVHDHEAFSNGFTGNEEWFDEDCREAYYNGQFEVPCDECGGSGKIVVVDEAACNEEQLKILKKWQDDMAFEAQRAREDAYTRWAEGGWAEG